MGSFALPLLNQAAGGGIGIDFIVMMGLMFGIFYFLLIRPQRKKETEHQKLLAALKRGDEVVLSSGIYGRIHAVEERTVLVEIAERTRIKVLKQAVTGLAAASAKALEAAPDDAAKVPAVDDDKAEKKAKK